MNYQHQCIPPDRVSERRLPERLRDIVIRQSFGGWLEDRWHVKTVEEQVEYDVMGSGQQLNTQASIESLPRISAHSVDTERERETHFFSQHIMRSSPQSSFLQSSSRQPFQQIFEYPPQELPPQQQQQQLSTSQEMQPNNNIFFTPPFCFQLDQPSIQQSYNVKEVKEQVLAPIETHLPTGHYNVQGAAKEYSIYPPIIANFKNLERLYFQSDVREHVSKKEALQRSTSTPLLFQFKTNVMTLLQSGIDTLSQILKERETLVNSIELNAHDLLQFRTIFSDDRLRNVSYDDVDRIKFALEALSRIEAATKASTIHAEKLRFISERPPQSLSTSGELRKISVVKKHILEMKKMLCVHDSIGCDEDTEHIRESIKRSNDLLYRCSVIIDQTLDGFYFEIVKTLDSYTALYRFIEGYKVTLTMSLSQCSNLESIESNMIEKIQQELISTLDILEKEQLRRADQLQAQAQRQWKPVINQASAVLMGLLSDVRQLQRSNCGDEVMEPNPYENRLSSCINQCQAILKVIDALSAACELISNITFTYNQVEEVLVFLGSRRGEGATEKNSRIQFIVERIKKINEWRDSINGITIDLEMQEAKGLESVLNSFIKIQEERIDELINIAVANLRQIA